MAEVEGGAGGIVGWVCEFDLLNMAHSVSSVPNRVQSE